MNIKVLNLSQGWRQVEILLPHTAQNQNPGGSMFGGAIASLADPIAALACASHFRDYQVWTKSLNVDFIRPGRSDLRLCFELQQQQLDDIAAQLQQHGRANPAFDYALYNTDNQLCCRIHCVVALRTPVLDQHCRGFQQVK